MQRKKHKEEVDVSELVRASEVHVTAKKESEYRRGATFNPVNWPQYTKVEAHDARNFADSRRGMLLLLGELTLKSPWITTTFNKPLHHPSSLYSPVKPFIIYSGMYLLEEWMNTQDEKPEMMAMVSESGWINGYLALRWLTDCFDPAT